MITDTRYKKVKSRLDEVVAERQSRAVRREQIQRFIDVWCRAGLPSLPGFGEGLWRATVEYIRVRSFSDIWVVFRDRREIPVDISK